MEPKTVAQLVAHLQTLPQDYTVMENSGYYSYEWRPVTDFSFTEVNDSERRVYLNNTGS